MTTNTSEDINDNIQDLSENYIKSAKSAGDAPAMQAAVCIILAASVFVLNIILPGTAMDIFHRISDLVASSNELISNPIEILQNIIDKA